MEGQVAESHGHYTTKSRSANQCHATDAPVRGAARPPGLGIGAGLEITEDGGVAIKDMNCASSSARATLGLTADGVSGQIGVWQGLGLR